MSWKPTRPFGTVCWKGLLNERIPAGMTPFPEGADHVRSSRRGAANPRPPATPYVPSSVYGDSAGLTSSTIPPQYELQTTVSTILPIPLFRLHQPCFSEVAYSPSGCGFRELYVLGNGRNGRPADAVFVGAVSKVDVHGDRPVGQIHPV